MTVNEYHREAMRTAPELDHQHMTKCTELMSQADLCFFAPGYYQSTGCCLEDHLAQVYGVKRLYLDYGLDGIGDNTDPYQFVYQPVAILRED